MKKPESQVFIFDVDGTVLRDQDILDSGIGLKFIRCLQNLKARGYRFCFITGNDFNVQSRRVLEPIIRHGLADRTFFFSDGGSRAFVHATGKDGSLFREDANYSKATVLNPTQVRRVESAFKTVVREFLADHPELTVPSVLWYKPADDYVELRIGPLRPSFLRDQAGYQSLCNKITNLGKSNFIRHAKIQIVDGRPGTLIVHLQARDILPEVAALTNHIHTRILYPGDGQGLAQPELEKRGGEVTCQIAIKPFNDPVLREQFRDAIAVALGGPKKREFNVLLGGSTTIDIQRIGVDKQAAIKHLARTWKLKPTDMTYFGDEFGQYGNDLPVALMANGPACIVNVGERPKHSMLAEDHMVNDGNGPTGTVNYLTFLLSHF